MCYLKWLLYNANVTVPLTCSVQTDLLCPTQAASSCPVPDKPPCENNWDRFAVALRMLWLCPSLGVTQHGGELGDLPAQGNCQSPSGRWQTLNMVKSLSQRWGNRSWVTTNHNGNLHKTATLWLPKRRSSQCWWQWLTHSPPAFPRAENLLKLLQPLYQMTRCRL